MKRTTEFPGKTVDEERQAKLDVLLPALDKAGLPRDVVSADAPLLERVSVDAGDFILMLEILANARECLTVKGTPSRIDRSLFDDLFDALDQRVAPPATPQAT